MSEIAKLFQYIRADVKGFEIALQQAIAQGQRAAQDDSEDDEAARDEEMSRGEIMAQLAAAQRVLARGA